MSLNVANALENNPASEFGIAISNDAEKIAYSVNGSSKTSLIFIHGGVWIAGSGKIKSVIFQKNTKLLLLI